MWNVLSVSTNLSFSKFFNLSFKIHFCEIERTRHVTDQEDNIHYVHLLSRQQSREKIVVLFATNVFQIINCVFASTFCDFVDYLWLLSEKSSIKSLSWTNCVSKNFVYCSRIHFTFTKTMNKLVSTKVMSLYRWSVHPWWESHNWVATDSELKLHNQKLTKRFFNNTRSHFTMLCEKNWICRVRSRCKLWIYRFFKEQRCKVLANLWRVMWRSLQFWRNFWCYYCWKTSWIEYYLH